MVNIYCPRCEREVAKAIPNREHIVTTPRLECPYCLRRFTATGRFGEVSALTTSKETKNEK